MRNEKARNWEVENAKTTKCENIHEIALEYL